MVRRRANLRGGVSWVGGRWGRRKEKGKDLRNSEKDIPHGHLPEPNEPVPLNRRHKGLTNRQLLQFHIPHLPEILESRKENNRQRRAIISQKHSNVMGKQSRITDYRACVSDYEDEERDGDAEIGRCRGGFGELEDEDLDAFLDVDGRYVETGGCQRIPPPRKVTTRRKEQGTRKSRN